MEGAGTVPQRSPQRDRLVQPGEAPFPRHLGQGVKGPSEVAGETRAHRHREPAAGQQVYRRQGLRGLDRPSQERQQRAGSKGHGLGRRGERGQHRQRLDAWADQRVIDEERGESQAFGPAAERDQFSRVAALAPLGGSGRKQYTDVHGNDAHGRGS